MKMQLSTDKEPDAKSIDPARAETVSPYLLSIPEYSS